MTIFTLVVAFVALFLLRMLLNLLFSVGTMEHAAGGFYAPLALSLAESLKQAVVAYVSSQLVCRLVLQLPNVVATEIESPLVWTLVIGGLILGWFRGVFLFGHWWGVIMAIITAVFTNWGALDGLRLAAV